MFSYLYSLIRGRKTTTQAERDWWRQAVVYQIYPRSFADDNGDGIGDFKGVTSRVEYLRDLGIDAVWFSPFSPSALKDGGYDVSDYRNVDPRIGTLTDFDAMVKSLNSVGIKIIVDVVPNHCSEDHIWFKEAVRAGKGSEERKRFHFYDGLGVNGENPPQDWQCTFGGPAWSPSGVNDGQWYLHTFDSSQPDWNWDHPDVTADFLKTIKFWADRGVSGFRVDVADSCKKDMDVAMGMNWAERKRVHLKHEKIGSAVVDPMRDLDEVLEVYKGWRGVFNRYDPPITAVAEAWVRPDRVQLYADPKGLGQCFSFDIMFKPFSAQAYKEGIQGQYERVKKTLSSMTWVLSNHDFVRHPNRFGLPQVEGGLSSVAKVSNEWLKSGGKVPHCDWEKGIRRARAATLLLLALPGSTYIYQGEELGLPEVVDIPDDKRQDPTFFRTKGSTIGRDGCRVPLPWTTLPPNFGYSIDHTIDAHLPMPGWMGEYAVSRQQGKEGSVLEMYKTALRLRREYQCEEVMEWVETGQADVLRFQRPNGWECVVNFGGGEVDLPRGEVLMSSGSLEGKLPGGTTVWIKAGPGT